MNSPSEQVPEGGWRVEPLPHRAWWKRLLGIDKPPVQRTWCYCPRCGADLCTEPGTVGTDTDFVRYECGRCHYRSVWDFDLFPTPIVISLHDWTHHEDCDWVSCRTKGWGRCCPCWGEPDCSPPSSAIQSAHYPTNKEQT